MFQCYDQVSYTQKIPSCSLTLLLASTWQPGRLQFSKGNAAHTDQHFLCSLNNILACSFKQINSFYFQTTAQKVENYYSVTSVRLLTGKPPCISKSGLQAEFHTVKLHKSMTFCESVLYLVCSISKSSVTLKSVLQRAVQKELQQLPFHI